jgi:predicted RNase H-like nuclease
MREVFIGFDSAWTDSSKNPGAITGFVIEDGGPGIFFPPSLATFDQAARSIEGWSADADYVLIAIDQPTVVPNHDGCRPVDRVAGSLVSGLRGGVQPARRGGSGASMFGDSAPIWRFLSTIGAVQNPIEARNAVAGRYRGREPGCPGPPAQIRTGSFPAYGSYLGCLTAKRSRGHG